MRNLIFHDHATKAKLLAHHGAGLNQQQGRECLPNQEFPAWHRAKVFKEPARESRLSAREWASRAQRQSSWRIRGELAA
jgi:hypothetical protein